MNSHDSEETDLDALPPPPTEWTSPGSTAPTDEDLPALPGFELLHEVGRGGMGRVYKARQTDLGRTVAIKMLHAGRLTDAELRDRFMREARAQASLQHPHIVQLLQVNEDRGRPYLVMEFVEGGSLERRLKGRSLPARVAATIVETLAHAVDHFHRRGLLHRDLKLANVLIAGGPDEPIEPSRIKIADFGLVRFWIDDGSERPSPATIAGTPNYMAPEQAEGKPASPAADIYSLGAVLYELLTGRPPFAGPTWRDTVAQVLADDPVSPRELLSSIPRDLETICLKCLAKVPAQRYRTAEELADDLRRYLDGRPVVARPVGPARRLMKWAARHPVPAALLVALAVVATSGAATVTWKWREAVAANIQADTNHRKELDALSIIERQKAEGEVLRRTAEARRRRDYAATMAMARDAWQAADIGRCQELLNQCEPGLRGWEWDFLRERLRAGHLTVRGDYDEVLAVALKPDGSLAASGGGTPRGVDQVGVVRLWNPVTGRKIAELEGGQGPITWLALHPSKPWVVAIHTRHDWERHDRGEPNSDRHATGECILWDYEAKRPLATQRGVARRAALSADGRLLAGIGSDHALHVWEVGEKAPWKEVVTLPPIPGVFTAFAFAPDGSQLAFATANVTGVVGGKLVATTELHVLRATDWKLEQAIPTGNVDVAAMAFSPNGGTLAFGNGTHFSTVLWDLKSRRLLRMLFGHESTVAAIAFAPDGATLATASRDRTVRLWDVASGRERHTLRGHAAEIHALAYGKEHRLMTGSADATIRFWHAERGQEPTTLVGHDLIATQARYSPDRKTLATRGAGGPIRLWDPATGQARAMLDGRAERFAWSPDSTRLVAGGGDANRASQPGELLLWDAATGKKLATLDGHSMYVTTVAWHPGGKRFVSCSGDPQAKPPVPGELIFWDAETLKARTPVRPPVGCVHDLAFSPDGKALVAVSWDHRVHLLDPESGEIRGTLEGHAAPVTRLAFSPDGMRLATGDAQGTIILWRGGTYSKERAWPATGGLVQDLSFHPDGTRLAVAGIDFDFRDSGTVKVWDVESGEEVMRLRGTYLATFSPDGERLAVNAYDSLTRPGRVHLWDAPRSREIVTVRPGGIGLFGLALSRDGGRVAVSSAGLGDHSEIQLRDPIDLSIRGSLNLGREMATALAFHPADSRRLASGHKDGRVALWDLEGNVQVASQRGHAGQILRVAYTPDGETLATAGLDGFVKLWNAGDLQPRASWRGHPRTIFDVAFHADGITLATASVDRTVVRWDTRTGTETARIRVPAAAVSLAWRGDDLVVGLGNGDIAIWSREGEPTVFARHGAPVRSLAFSSSGRVLYSAGDDHAVRAWDGASGDSLSVYLGHFDMVRVVAIHPSRPRLFSSSLDQTLRAWEAVRD